MSRLGIRATDLMCRISNWNNLIEHNVAPPGSRFEAVCVAENDRWRAKRDKEIVKLREILKRLTKEEYFNGRWDHASLWTKEAQWTAMQEICK